MLHVCTHLTLYFVLKFTTILLFICLKTFSSNYSNQNETWLRHLRHITEEGGTGKYLGGIWEAPGGSQRLQEARRLQEAPNHESRCLSRLEFKSSIKMLILHCVFEGQIIKYCKLQGKMLRGSLGRSATDLKAPWDNTVRTPTDKSVWGKSIRAPTS